MAMGAEAESLGGGLLGTDLDSLDAAGVGAGGLAAAADLDAAGLGRGTASVGGGLTQTGPSPGEPNWTRLGCGVLGAA